MIIQYIIATFLAMLVAWELPPRYTGAVFTVVVAGGFIDLVLRIGVKQWKPREKG